MPKATGGFPLVTGLELFEMVVVPMVLNSDPAPTLTPGPCLLLISVGPPCQLLMLRTALLLS